MNIEYVKIKTSYINKMDMDQKILMSAKVAFFIYIVLSPFINYKYLTFINQMSVKVILLIIIVAASFVDLQLSIIMTLAFLILMINLNKDMIFGTNTKEHFAVRLPVAELQRIKEVPGSTISEFPDQCTNYDNKPSLNINLYDLYMDPKIKPYEAYIRQLSNPLDVENASNAGPNLF